MDERTKRTLDDVVSMAAKMNAVEREILLAYASGIAAGKKLAATKADTEEKSDDGKEVEDND